MLNIHLLFHALYPLKISLFKKSKFLVLEYLLVTQNGMLVIAEILDLSDILELSIAGIVMNIFSIFSTELIHNSIYTVKA